VARREEFEWQFDFDYCGQLVDVHVAHCAHYQLSPHVKCVTFASDNNDAVYPPWTVCDERFGAMAEYDQGVGSIDGGA